MVGGTGRVGIGACGGAAAAGVKCRTARSLGSLLRPVGYAVHRNSGIDLDAIGESPFGQAKMLAAASGVVLVSSGSGSAITGGGGPCGGAGGMNAGSVAAAGAGGPLGGGGVDGGVIIGGLLWVPGLPFWLGLGLVDAVDPRAWALPPKILIRRRRQLLGAVVVVVPTAPTTTIQIPTAIGESALKPLPLLSSLYPLWLFPPDENPDSVPHVMWSSGKSCPLRFACPSLS